MNVFQTNRSESPAGEAAAPAVIGGSYLVGLGAIATVLLTHFGFPLDDSYIYQTLARNVAHGYPMGSGATSPAWTMIQAANFKCIHLDPVIFNIILSWLILSSIGYLFYLLLLHDGIAPRMSLALASLPAFSGNFLWLAMIGMEHLLFVGLVLFCIHARFSLDWQLGAVLTGIGAGALILVRPEAILLGPAFLIGTYVPRQPKRAIVAASSIWLGFVFIAFSINLHISGTVFPSTLDGRKWLYFAANGGPHSLRSLIIFTVDTVLRPSMDLSLWLAHPGLMFVTPLLLFFTLFILLTGVDWVCRNRLSRFRFLLLIALLHICIFFALFPSEGQGGRYQPLTLFLVFPCMFLGLTRILRAKHMTAWAVMAICAASSLHTWRIVTADGIFHINNTHGGASIWLKANAGDFPVAAFDIGRISFSSQRTVIDLGGLMEPCNAPYLSRGKLDGLIDREAPVFLVLPSGFTGMRLHIRNPGLKVMESCSPQPVWQVGFIYTRHAEQCQSIYRRR